MNDGDTKLLPATVTSVAVKAPKLKPFELTVD
jgi:hypothetical protein